MAASTVVIKRILGKFVSLQLLRKTAKTPRSLCFRCVHPSVSHPLPGLGARRFYNTGNVKNDQINQDPNISDRWAESELGYNQKAEEEEEEYEHGIKQRILTASLKHVMEYGWTKEAIEAGARDEGLSDASHGMFERGGAEIISHFYRKCNIELVEYLKQEVEKVTAEGLERPKTRPFIQNAVETRLKMVIPYHSIWKEAMAIQTFPQNAPEAWKNLSDLCDDIWYYAGDRSVDFDWYTKRFSLAACYKATEIYMLQDKSPDFQDTWIFLDNRLNDLQGLGDLKRSLGPLKEGIVGLLEMGRNVIGMNSRRR